MTGRRSRPGGSTGPIPAQRLLLRRDTIGEIVREDGVFRAELRSAQQGLNAVRGRVYQGLCDAELGDARCGVESG